GLPDSALHRFGQPAQVRVARGELGPGVADADHRPAVEHFVGEALRAHPGPVDEPVPVLLTEPVVEATTPDRRLRPLTSAASLLRGRLTGYVGRQLGVDRVICRR